MDPRAKPGALTRDVNTRLSAAEADPQTRLGAPAAAPAAVDEKETESMLLSAIDRGVNYVDTAYPYHDGMSGIKHVEENLRSAENSAIGSFGPEESRLIERVREKFRERTVILKSQAQPSF